MLNTLSSLINNPILIAIGAVFAIFAAWYFQKQIVKWVQAYRNQRQSSEVEEARKQAQADNTAANAESDKLKEIDGR